MKIWKSSISSPTHIPDKPLTRLVTHKPSVVVISLKLFFPGLSSQDTFDILFSSLQFARYVCLKKQLSHMTFGKTDVPSWGLGIFNRDLEEKKSWTFHFVHFTIHFVIHRYRVDILSITIAIAENTKK